MTPSAPGAAVGGPPPPPPPPAAAGGAIAPETFVPILNRLYDVPTLDSNAASMRIEQVRVFPPLFQPPTPQGGRFLPRGAPQMQLPPFPHTFSEVSCASRAHSDGSRFLPPQLSQVGNEIKAVIAHTASPKEDIIQAFLQVNCLGPSLKPSQHPLHPHRCPHPHVHCR